MLREYVTDLVTRFSNENEAGSSFSFLPILINFKFYENLNLLDFKITKKLFFQTQGFGLTICIISINRSSL
jgi:hypothetical protein